MAKWIRIEGDQEICTVACPKCKKLLNSEKDDKKINVNITTKDGEGILHLSAIWDDYSHTIEGVTIAQREVVEMFCPYCNESLISEEICEDCDATTSAFSFSMGFINICNRRGCKWHLRFILKGD
jgi:ssDNA-binding Zn-finger/Zn-ribbon topoisomerase 1